MLQIDDLPLQREDAARDTGALVEELLLDLVDVVLDAVEHIAVSAGHELEHAPQHAHRAALGDLGMLVEQPPHPLQIDLAVRGDGDEEVGPTNTSTSRHCTVSAASSYSAGCATTNRCSPMRSSFERWWVRSAVATPRRSRPSVAATSRTSSGLGAVRADPQHPAVSSGIAERRVQRGVGGVGSPVAVDDAVRLGHESHPRPSRTSAR